MSLETFSLKGKDRGCDGRNGRALRGDHKRVSCGGRDFEWYWRAMWIKSAR